MRAFIAEWREKPPDQRKFRIGTASFELWFAPQKSIGKREVDNKVSHAVNPAKAFLERRLENFEAGRAEGLCFARSVWYGAYKIAVAKRKSNTWAVLSLAWLGIGGDEAELEQLINAF